MSKIIVPKQKAKTNDTNIVLSVVFSWFGINTCKHEFRGRDLHARDMYGNISWSCCKCNEGFIAECGLDVLKKGICIGDWGFSDNQ